MTGNHPATLMWMTPDPTNQVAVGWRAKTPNALTVLRLLMTVACVALLTLFDASAGDDANATIGWAALALFVIASSTDALDGHLARRWNAISRFGRVMDPLADKVLVLGVFIVLAGPNFLSATGTHITGVLAWMPVVALTRELLVTSLRAVYESSGIDFSAVWTGKLKMIAQVGGLSLILLGLPLCTASDEAGAIWLRISTISAWTITIVTAISVVPYLIRARAASGAM